MSVAPTALADLVEALPPCVVVTSAPEIEKYRQDVARDSAAGRPAAAVRAEDASQVQVALRWATRHGVPVVPRGAGTGLSGGSSAVDDGITLSLERMRTVVIDRADQVAIVQPGALTGEVKRAAAELGLWYPPDPASAEICSIGGNLATNAGGLCCLKYGVTADYVLGLDVVLADGTLVTLGGRALKDVAGLPLLKLFVGSEGTLGVITGAVLRLLPAPGPASALVATFPSMTAASRAVVTIRSRVRASMLELMDHTTINAVEDCRPHGLDRNAGALLIARSDAPGAAAQDEIDTMHRACLDEGASEVFSSTDPDEAEMFVSARRSAIVALEHRGTVMLEDVGVPVPRLPDLVARVEAIAERHHVEIAVVAHAGDGNTHPVIVYDAADARAKRAAGLAFADVMGAAVALGGTITGEHGVGRTKRRFLASQLGETALALNWAVKRALDPAGILNPGALLEPLVGARSQPATLVHPHAFSN